MRVASDVGLPLHSPAAAVVFTTVLTQGPLSRVAVVRRTSLSSAAVTKAVRPLIEAGYLVELAEGRPEASIGRPASPLRVRADRAFFVGVKLTGDELISTNQLPICVGRVQVVTGICFSTV